MFICAELDKDRCRKPNPLANRRFLVCSLIKGHRTPHRAYSSHGKLGDGEEFEEWGQWSPPLIEEEPD